MTLGHERRHKHRAVTVPRWFYFRVLTRVVFRTRDKDRVERSPYPYGRGIRKGEFEYRLDVQGVLHRWTGACFFINPRKSRRKSGS